MSELAPRTIEGWYALHQVMRVDWRALRASSAQERATLLAETERLMAGLAAPERAGWSAAYRLIGGGADFMLVHFRETLDELADVQLAIRRSRLGALLTIDYDFTSVTEAGLYHASAEAAADAVDDLKKYAALLDEAAAAEAASPHVRTRLYPEPPADMRVISFYPMSKRRVHPDNWYALDVAERNRMMAEHGLSGRRFAGRIFQVITGAVGFDDWEWGVTLFARDPLDIKRVVTELRYDEASTKYGEFGTFFVGVRMGEAEWGEFLSVDGD
ncbi:MAG TPA: hydrogen peroxide-dependent heme synthase [Longimicrobiales bacterium]|nr:hydrogen peroxide-dependent heme synthase [Longimicrobiales bacterium]